MDGCNFFMPGSCTVPILEVIGNAIAFASDPAGYWAQKMAIASGQLMGVMQFLTDSLEPNFGFAWWLRLYSINFAFAIICLLITQSALWITVVRRKISPTEAVEATFGGGWIFIVSAMWGPGLMVGFSQIISAASAGAIGYMLGISGTDFFTALAQQWISATPDQFLGGSIVALTIAGVMAASMMGAIIILVLQLAAQYLVGGLFALFVVWFTHPSTRKFAVAGIMVVLALFVTHFLLFLGLGASWMLMSGIGLNWAQPGQKPDGWSMLISFGVTAAAAALAVFSPMGLIAIFRGAFPMIGGGGTSSKGGFSAPGSHGVPGGRGGKGSGSGTNDAAEKSSSDNSTANEDGGGGDGESGEGVPASSTVESGAGGGGGGGSTTGSTTGSASAGAETGGATGAAEAGAAGAAEGVAAGGAAAGSAAGATAAAGTAASATGVGAVIGVPLLLAAAAVKAAQLAESTADQVAEAGVDS